MFSSVRPRESLGSFSVGRGIPLGARNWERCLLREWREEESSHSVLLRVPDDLPELVMILVVGSQRERARCGALGESLRSRAAWKFP